jgi:chaperone required for assembly of F1-ATPase
MINQDKVVALFKEILDKNKAVASIDNGTIKIEVGGQTLKFPSDNSVVRSSINRY